MAEKKNIYQRISAIQKDVTAVAKDANVDGKYTAVTNDAVTKMLRPLMVKHGVISAIDIINVEPFDTGVKWGQRPLIQLRADARVVYINVDKPEDQISVVTPVYADDNGDKGPQKLATVAQKIADLKMFRIQTGEDEEQRIDDSKLTAAGEETLSEKNLAALWDVAEKSFGDNAAEELNKIGKLMFRVDGWQNILDKHFGVALENLKNKAGASNE